MGRAFFGALLLYSFKTANKTEHMGLGMIKDKLRFLQNHHWWQCAIYWTSPKDGVRASGTWKTADCHSENDSHWIWLGVPMAQSQPRSDSLHPATKEHQGCGWDRHQDLPSGGHICSCFRGCEQLQHKDVHPVTARVLARSCSFVRPSDFFSSKRCSPSLIQKQPLMTYH